MEKEKLNAKLSSQAIYETLMNSGGFESMNPYDIVNQISEFNFNHELNSESDELYILPKDDTPEMDGNVSDELLKSLDNFSDNISNITSVFGKTKNLDTLLDELLEQEDDINSIVFDAEHENIYEQEVPLNIDIIESYKEAITDEDIRIGLNNPNKKIGSSLQRSIVVFELYQSNALVFRDEAIDLAELIINKLIAYQNIIIDFDKIETVTEAFLRGAFDIITKFWSLNDILQNIEIINIDDEIYVSLIKDIIPNASKYWASNSFQLNTDIEKLELLRQLDPSSELLLDEPEKLTARELPFERINAKMLGNKREKKLRYPIWFVERITEEVISISDLDNRVFKYLDLILPEPNWNEVKLNCKVKSSDHYRFQINPEVFNDLFNFVEITVLEACDVYLRKVKEEIDITRAQIKELKEALPAKLITAGGVCFQNLYLDDKMINSLPISTKLKLRKLEDLEFVLLDLEHKYIIKEDILRNIFEIISFSCYRTGLDKVKLITYHYLCRYLENLAIKFKEENDIHKVRGYTSPLEVFRFDLVNVLCFDDTLKKFIFTIKELVSKWVMKYSFGSKMAKFYFDIMMITPDMLSDSIIRIIALSIIKNKNPMTLRAIYSSYVSLIHLIIDSNINLTDLSKKKYGNFKALYSNDKEYDNNKLLVPSKFQKSYTDEVMLRIWLYKNPRLLNENYHLNKRLNLYKFLEVDSLRVYATKPKDIGIYDWYFYYTKYLKHIEKDENIVYKIKSKFLKSDKKNSQLKIIEIMAQELLYDKLISNIYDSECVMEILGVIAEDISMRTINRGYMDKEFNLIVKSNQDYLNYIHKSLTDIRDNI